MLCTAQTIEESIRPTHPVHFHRFLLKHFDHAPGLAVCCCWVVGIVRQERQYNAVQGRSHQRLQMTVWVAPPPPYLSYAFISFRQLSRPRAPALASCRTRAMRVRGNACTPRDTPLLQSVTDLRVRHSTRPREARKECGSDVAAGPLHSREVVGEFCGGRRRRRRSVGHRRR